MESPISSEEDHKSFFERKKAEIIKSEKSIKNGLSATDRSILLDFFGYTNGNKDLSEAPIYVKDCLSVVNHPDETNFDVKSQSTISRIFPVSQKQKWWKIGQTLTPSEQTACLRAFQTFTRIYPTDICMKRLSYGTKILLSGLVNYQSDRQTDR